MAGSIERLDGVYLVVGPAGLEMVSGEAEALGVSVGEGQRLVVPLGRRVPVLFRGARVLVSGGRVERGSLDVYRRLEEAARKVAGLGGRILLVGPTDSGKSTLAAWAVNLLGGKARLLTVDVGQNEYYAPAFEALLPGGALLPGLAAGGSLSTCFVGSFTPSRSHGRYIACASRLSRLAPGDVVVDTDGWVARPEGFASKVSLAEAVGADYVVTLGLPRDYGDSLARAAGAAHVLSLGDLGVRRKDREERRVHRERLLAARLVGSRPRPIRAVETVLVGSPVFNCESKGHMGPVVYSEDCGDRVVVVVKKPPKPRRQGRLLVLEEGWERNRIAAVLGDDGNHHIGLVERVNYRSRVFTVRTRYEGPARALLIGEARVDISLGG
ncbi:MAG: Clp1/GlmU family protein [Desulfurococcales archaeon]|nr:Clp1/GlmU family protein [Desulfurococcales archaeon]